MFTHNEFSEFGALAICMVIRLSHQPMYYGKRTVDFVVTKINH